MDVWLSCAEAVHPDELNEELDMFPLLMPNVVVREWSDSAAERHRVDPDGAQGCGNAGCERVRSLLAWRDPRATSFCLVAAIVLYVTPIRGRWRNCWPCGRGRE